jgi:iron complex transport system permease protein
MSKNKKILITNSLILVFLLIFLFFLDLSIGANFISPKGIFNYIFGINSDNSIILESFRFPRVITAILSGIALSFSGLIMQTIFRNPLAGPYVLGISGGAGLGVAIVTLTAGALSGFVMLSNWSVIFSAWVGASLVLLVIFYASLKVKDIMTLLVFGILLGSAISAVIGILQYFRSCFKRTITNFIIKYIDWNKYFFIFNKTT